ncbi:Hypothetical_protein [Hexamita inflata]|uniref:Hypothetical_protein n=1 Tax=Hexamita inflata TaxID=28002 RepID=A0AA86UG91_9EUKA|nr:Hypothetical protein HINF_LOCUS38371 [Hexamita inflata]
MNYFEVVKFGRHIHCGDKNKIASMKFLIALLILSCRFHKNKLIILNITLEWKQQHENQRTWLKYDRSIMLKKIEIKRSSGQVKYPTWGGDYFGLCYSRNNVRAKWFSLSCICILVRISIAKQVDFSTSHTNVFGQTLTKQLLKLSRDELELAVVQNAMHYNISCKDQYALLMKLRLSEMLYKIIS